MKSGPKEQTKAQAATNLAYGKRPYRKAQKAYVRKRIPGAVQYRVSKARVQTQSSKGVLKIPECTAHYMKTVLDPFESPAGACLPSDLFPLPSQKLKVFSRGICTLGTTGYGFVSAGIVLANDSPVSYTTTAASVMGSATLLGAVTGITPGYCAKLPWTVTDINSNVVQGRPVALGLRVRYTGREDGRNGILNFYEDQDHADLNAVSYDTTRQRDNTYACRPNGAGNWDTIVYSGPIAPAEMEFRNAQLLTGNHVLLCAISGVAGDQYEFEVFEHIEAIGVNTTGKSVSHADTQSFGKAQEALKESSSTSAITVAEGPGIVRRFISAMIKTLPFVVEQGSNVMKALSGDPMALLNGLAGSAGMIYKSLPRGQYAATRSIAYK